MSKGVLHENCLKTTPIESKVDFVKLGHSRVLPIIKSYTKLICLHVHQILDHQIFTVHKNIMCKVEKIKFPHMPKGDNNGLEPRLTNFWEYIWNEPLQILVPR
jgi:hypothetical protein